MLRSILGLLAIGVVLVYSKKCVDGKHNVIKVSDTSNFKGKVRVKMEIGTYDEDKKPICASGRPQITIPGYLKVLKGKYKIYEKVKGTKRKPLTLAFTVDKDSVTVGTLCDKGVTKKDDLVPRELCNLDLCIFETLCDFFSTKTNGAVDVVPLLGQEFFHLRRSGFADLITGDWRVSVDLMHGEEKLAGLRLESYNDPWVKVEEQEGTDAEEDDEGEETEKHDEL
ncbi:hypothetical protein GCK32_007629 [Trichostrongylus colubriformis]|uniref:Uncharacterized protein n=1 Tax=Trichostrongylus colubriformis TaxID=6319 RepID=A0AAN8IIK7_TRICO